MRRVSFALLAVLGSFVASSAMARDDVSKFSIADVLNKPEFAAKLEGVKFYFGKQAHPAVARTIGTYTSNKKTNAVGKSDIEACQWVFLSALVSFHDRAIAEGGDAVVDITGYYKKQPFSSETEFQCGAGATIAGVTLKGTVVKLK